MPVRLETAKRRKRRRRIKQQEWQLQIFFCYTQMQEINAFWSTVHCISPLHRFGMNFSVHVKLRFGIVRSYGNSSNWKINLCAAKTIHHRHHPQYCTYLISSPLSDLLIYFEKGAVLKSRKRDHNTEIWLVLQVLNPSCPNPGRRESLKAFVKLFEAPQRSVKIKI